MRNIGTTISLAIVAAVVLVSSQATRSVSGEGQPELKVSEKWAVATFAGGCFWCMEGPFDDIDGVKATISGYTGGAEKNPTYKQVANHQTGHAEAVRIEYDPEKVTYEELLYVFWRNIDPTTPNRQFCDWGTQYRPEIFYHGDEQKALAEASRAEIEAMDQFSVVAVAITPATVFYEAEEYHQDFYINNPDHYYKYRKGCGRDRRLEELWGKSDKKR